MKKFVFVVMAMFAMSFAACTACGDKAGNKSENDSVKADTTVVDTLVVDSNTVDNPELIED